MLLLLFLAPRAGLSDRREALGEGGEDVHRNNNGRRPTASDKTADVLYGRLITDLSGLVPRRLLDVHLKPETVRVSLRPVTDLVSSQFSVWVRNGSSTREDRLVPLPTCLYAGHLIISDGRHLDVSLSTCGGGGGGDQGENSEAIGNVVLDGYHYLLKPDGRAKREVEGDEEGAGGHGHLHHQEVLVVQTAGTGGECGLNTRNKKRLMVEERPVVWLQPNTRTRRSATPERFIEVAVFVDNIMYSNVEARKSPGEDTLKKIRDMVFAYLNAVQIMYRSGRLANKLKLVLVRLDIMQAADASLDKHGGDIEKYLEAFCQWQKGKNPGGGQGSSADQTNGAHWDHALLLTGLNLYDGTPAKDSVIGLAWVRSVGPLVKS